MKKRIGTKIYNTDTAEYICSIDGGQLYQKRTRDREWFAVMDDGSVRPLDVYNPLDVLLMETGHIAERETEPKMYHVRVDKDTHGKLSKMAKSEAIPISQVVKNLVDEKATSVN